MSNNDPIGAAIWDFHLQKPYEDIRVKSDILEDDFLPTAYLFREYEDFPELEKVAMQHCKGKILDVGAAAGPHALYLSRQGFDVSTVEISPLAHEFLKKILPNNKHFFGSIQELKGKKFDTILLMMNGIGLAETFDNVDFFLEHLVSLLEDDGCIICESSDVLDIFEDDEGGLWIDLNADYYGDFKFKMHYKNHQSDWFDWVYIDRVNFQKKAEKIDLDFSLLYDDKNSFLIKLNKIK